MDGTILHPGLLIFNVMVAAFEETNNKHKLSEINKIAKNYKNVPFEESYRRFLPLLKGEDKKHLQDLTKKIVELYSYQYAKLVIKKLQKKYKIRTFMISLTTNFVAEVVQNYFNFEKTCAVICNSQKKKGRETLTGTTGTVVTNPQIMKKNMLEQLITSELGTNKFSFFFDSEDDKLVAKRANIVIRILQTEKVDSELRSDIILEGDDPWEKFYGLL